MTSAVTDLIDVSRADWLPRDYEVLSKVIFKPISRWEASEVHHTGVDMTDAFKSWLSAFNYHVFTLGWSDIWYNLGIHPDGRIVELRGAGAANSDRRFMTINFPGNDQATEAQWESLHRIRLAMAEDDAGTDLLYHAMRGGTVCPGTNTINRIHQIWAAEQTTGGLLVSASDIDPEFYLEGMARIVKMGTIPVAILRVDGLEGYATVHLDGGVATFGDFPFLGSVPLVAGDLLSQTPRDNVTAAVAFNTMDGGIGYTIVTKRGAIFNFGSAAYSGRLDIIGD